MTPADVLEEIIWETQISKQAMIDLRKKHDLTHEHMAAVLSMSPGTYRGWEGTKRKAVPMTAFRLACLVLGEDVTDWLERYPD